MYSCNSTVCSSIATPVYYTGNAKYQYGTVYTGISCMCLIIILYIVYVAVIIIVQHVPL